MRALSLLVLGAAACAGPPHAKTSSPPPHPQVAGATEESRRVAPTGQAWITPLARGSNAFVGRLELAPRAVVPQHSDPTEEFIHILQGRGTLMMDGQSFEVGAGHTIFMPPHSVVSYRNGEERLVALQVFAGPEPARKYNDWAPATEQR